MTSLQDRTDALLARHRADRSVPTRQEIDDLYTDGCAEVLILDARKLRLKRQLRAALAPGADERGEAAKLLRELDETSRKLAELGELVRQLRAAVDWKRAEAPQDRADGAPVNHASRFLLSG